MIYNGTRNLFVVAGQFEKQHTEIIELPVFKLKLQDADLDQTKSICFKMT